MNDAIGGKAEVPCLGPSVFPQGFPEAVRDQGLRLSHNSTPGLVTSHGLPSKTKIVRRGRSDLPLMRLPPVFGSLLSSLPPLAKQEVHKNPPGKRSGHPFGKALATRVREIESLGRQRNTFLPASSLGTPCLVDVIDLGQRGYLSLCDFRIIVQHPSGLDLGSGRCRELLSFIRLGGKAEDSLFMGRKALSGSLEISRISGPSGWLVDCSWGSQTPHSRYLSIR